ncbi:MAG TPA: fumarate hydratase [Spirochaetota bacterium]|nr:fumarate hydratase [Spirochaetota bacterium]
MGGKPRTVDLQEVKKAVKSLSISACTDLNRDVEESFKRAIEKEESPVGRAIFEQLLKNADIARQQSIPICQDTGFTVVFLEIGQDVSFSGGYLGDAISEGVSEAYKEGYLRKSIVKNAYTNPENTGDNTPPIVHTRIVPGDRVKITVLPKGGGSENMSRIKMMKPADGMEGVRDFVVETVRGAGANPCPPILVGVGLGGTFDYVAYLAKKSLLREIGERNPDPELARYEVEWLETINRLGIGPAGLGGRFTALDLFIEAFPRHIASYPAAVNIQCHAARSKTHTL